MKLVVNGAPREVDVPPDTPLLWVLREELGLAGTKYGCGQALCGACTVHVDGHPKRSCVTAVGDIGDQPITTIEGLAAGMALHPVQQAWLEDNVPQCGYCQSGQIHHAAATGEFAANMYVTILPSVLWGWNPGTTRTTPPLPHDRFVAAFKAWVDAGGACP